MSDSDFSISPQDIRIPPSILSEDRESLRLELEREILETNLLPKLRRRTRLSYLKNFGVPHLVFRLACQIERERRLGGKPECGNPFVPTGPRQLYHPKCQKKAENRRSRGRG